MNLPPHVPARGRSRPIAPSLPSPAFALDYPTRPVRLIVLYTPGGAADITGRLMGQWL